jgi:hypothetical protein
MSGSRCSRKTLEDFTTRLSIQTAADDEVFEAQARRL